MAELHVETGVLPDVRVFDLGRLLDPSIPHHPAQVPLTHRMTKLHGETVYAGGVTAANDMITMGLHNGTHVDALGHFAASMKLWNGADASAAQDPGLGLLEGSGIESFGPLVWRAVLADVPRMLGLDALPDDHAITREELRSATSGVRLDRGCALLIRTGWGRQWPSCEYGKAQPGPDAGAISWAYDDGARLFGSDTMAFEWTGDPGMPVHRFLLVDHGVHIVEGLNLEDVASAGVREFVMVIAPLPFTGGTAGPVRPVGLVPR